MIWDSWSDFWAMGGRAFFVWGSYGATALCVVVELVLLGRARKKALAALHDDLAERMPSSRQP